MNKYLIFLVALFFFSPVIATEVSFSSKSSREDSIKFKRKVPFRFLLITGCARSGTKYISEVLKLCGLDVEHEGEAEDGIISWMMAANSDSAPYGPGGNEFQFIHVFHQVRHPLKAIPSICTDYRTPWPYIYMYVPEIQMNETLFVRAIKYYYYWNLMAEKKAEWTYQIEQIESALGEMSQRLGIQLDPNAIDKVPKNTHTLGPTPSCTWVDIYNAVGYDLCNKLIDMATRYGYSVPE